MTKVFGTLTNLFALWVVIGTAWAIAVPAHFVWFRPWIPLALGVVMLGMGLTLRLEDFREVVKHPVSVLIGVTAQFVIMPSLAFLFAKWFRLDPAFALGNFLLSSRHLDTVFVVNPERNEVVWALRDGFKAQHDARLHVGQPCAVLVVAHGEGH